MGGRAHALRRERGLEHGDLLADEAAPDGQGEPDREQEDAR